MVAKVAVQERSQALFDAALPITAQGIRDSLDYLPDGAYKTYCAWLLDSPQHSAEWLQLVAIHGLIRLTNSLLEGLLTTDEMMQALVYSVPMNVAQMYEVISDNLAIGLAHRQPDDATFEIRHHILYAFNDAVMERLLGHSTQPAVQQLALYEPLMRRVSAYHQSLNADKHLRLAEAFLTAHPYMSAHELEYSVYPGLVGNVETWVDLVEQSRHMAAYPLLRDGLVARYSAVNTLLREPDLSFEELMHVSTNAILVIPTLAYYGAVIGEAVSPINGYEDLLEDGTLYECYRNAALLVRLLNDLGTIVLEQPDENHRQLMDSLRDIQAEYGYDDLRAVLLKAADHHGVNLTRLRKDLSLCEINTSLYHPLKVNEVNAAIDAFDANVTRIRELYRQTMDNLESDLGRVHQYLGDSRIGDLVLRFVRFHQFIYSNSFKDVSGEYAI